MSVREFLLPEPGPDGWVDTDRVDRKGMGFLIKRYANGSDGGPFAVSIIHPVGFNNPAHFHTEPQFQVLLEGAVEFPAHKLEALAVHYSDANSPYGPFLVGEGFVLAILRQRAGAAQIYMSDRDGRKQRNPYGREFYGDAAAKQWRDAGAGVEEKSLIDAPQDGGPSSALLECPPHATLELGAARAGQFQVVVKGSILINDKEHGPYSMRYNVGDQPPSPLVVGANGATLLTLTFDPRHDGT